MMFGQRVEAEMLGQFGDVYRLYRDVVPARIPGFGGSFAAQSET